MNLPGSAIVDRVGQHSVPEPPPPPKDKPRYRFVVAIGGIVTLAFIAMAVVAAMFPERAPAAAEPENPGVVANPFPQLPSVDPSSQTGPTPGPPTGAPTSAPAPTTTTTLTTTKPPTTPASTANPPAGNVTASYRVAQFWDSGFQAEITLTNTSTSDTAWTIQLSYPSNVTTFVNAWIDGYGAQPVRTDTGLPEVTLSSGGPLAPGASIKVAVQFDKTGGSFAPSLRTVNGSAF